MPVPPEQKMALFCLLADARSEDREASVAAMESVYRIWKAHPRRSSAPNLEIWMLLSLARAMRFTPEDEARQLLDRARQLALKLFAEDSVEITSIDLDKAALLISAKKTEEAKEIMLKVCATREASIDPSDESLYPVIFYTCLSAVRFFCLEKEIGLATDVVNRFVARTFETFSGNPSEAATQFGVVVDVLQPEAMQPAQKHLVQLLRKELAARNIEDPSLTFKIHLAEASGQIVSNDLLKSLENLTIALDVVKEMTGERRLQSMLQGMAYKAMVCIQLGGDINLQEADRCLKLVTPYLQHFEPHIMLALVSHMLVMKKQTNPEETAPLEGLLPPSLRAKIEGEGIRAVYLDLMA